MPGKRQLKAEPRSRDQRIARVAARTDLALATWERIGSEVTR